MLVSQQGYWNGWLIRKGYDNVQVRIIISRMDLRSLGDELSCGSNGSCSSVHGNWIYGNLWDVGRNRMGVGQRRMEGLSNSFRFGLFRKIPRPRHLVQEVVNKGILLYEAFVPKPQA
jgi:hypothetical protein